MQPTPQDPQTYAIIGAAMEVHAVLGPGFPESVYAEALDIELSDRGVPHVREACLPVDYKRRRLASVYRVDFLCYARVLVELKALRALTTHEDAQVITYLKASRLPVALLINFGARSLEYQRFAL